jgi:hypothetical protein
MNPFHPVKIGKISTAHRPGDQKRHPQWGRDSQKVYELMQKHIFQMREGLRKVISEKRH